jgi:hypothetical protein
MTMLSIVSTGWSKDSPTEVCPARLYISSGRISRSSRLIELASFRSP